MYVVRDAVAAYARIDDAERDSPSVLEGDLMAGRLLSVCPKQTYNFNLAASSSTTVYLGNPRGFQAVDCVSGVLFLRVAAQTQVTGGTIKIGFGNAMIGPDDPGSIYVPPIADALYSFVEITINQGDAITAPGRLYPKAWTSGCGPMFLCYMTIAASGAGAVSITCSVDAALRDA